MDRSDSAEVLEVRGADDEARMVASSITDADNVEFPHPLYEEPVHRTPRPSFTTSKDEGMMGGSTSERDKDLRVLLLALRSEVRQLREDLAYSNEVILSRQDILEQRILDLNVRGGRTTSSGGRSHQRPPLVTQTNGRSPPTATATTAKSVGVFTAGKTPPASMSSTRAVPKSASEAVPFSDSSHRAAKGNNVFAHLSNSKPLTSRKAPPQERKVSAQ